MKVALGQKVKVSLPKAFQINKAHSESLVIKGVPTDITESEFKEFLDVNKISYAKAERLKSQKDGRVLPIFQLDISDPAKPRLYFPKTLLVTSQVSYTRWKNFVNLFRSCSASTAKVSVIRLKTIGQNRNV